MSRRASYHIGSRFVVDTEQVERLRAACSKSAKIVHVTQKEGLRVHTLKGVPGGKVDVLLPDSTGEAGQILVCEVGQKLGSFDGHGRWRVAVRTWPTQFDPDRNPEPSLQFPAPGKIIVDECDDGTHVIAYGPSVEGGMWGQRFARLEYTVEPGDRRGILYYHYRHYYPFLHRGEMRSRGDISEDIRSLADLWSLLPAVVQCEDIVVLNRLASECLYDYARREGWRKMTLRERLRAGLSADSPQWMKSDDPRLRTTSGAGEYTLRAANGDLDYIRTAHGKVAVE